MALEINSGVNYFLPVFAFLMVFIIIFAVLQKTKILNNKWVSVFLSFIMASFFIVKTEFVEFVQFTSSWMVVFIVLIFLLFVLIGFLPGVKEPFAFLAKGNVFSIVLLVLGVLFFVIASSYVFGWVFNWLAVYNWFHTDWFGFVLLLVIAALVSFVLMKAK